MNTISRLYFHCLPFHRLSARELYQQLALREDVFVVEQNCPYLDADGKDLNAHHLMGYSAGGHLHAYCRLLPPGVSYREYASIGRVVTSRASRGRGYGRALMQEALHWMERIYPGQPVKVSAQVYLTHFYQSFGFQPVGEEYLEDDIPHIGMTRETE